MTAMGQWRARLELPLNDIEDLFLAKKMFLDIRDLIKGDPALQRPDYFHTFLRLTYVAHISTLLRRNLTRNSKGHSFLGFLDSVAVEKKGEKESVLSDIAELERRGGACKEFFDKQVAHLDKKPPVSLPTYDDLHAIIDLLVELSEKYSKQCAGEDWRPKDRAIGDEWLTIFDSAWYSSS